MSSQVQSFRRLCDSLRRGPLSFLPRAAAPAAAISSGIVSLPMAAYRLTNLSAAAK